MKKIIAFILVALSILSCFSACGKTEKENVNNTNPDVTENQIQTGNEDTDDGVKWKQEELTTPSITDISIHEVTLVDGTSKIKIAKTPFNYNIENFRKAIDKSDFIKEKYNLGMSTSETIEGKVYEEGHMVHYAITDKIVGDLKGSEYPSKEYFSDLAITLRRETKLYDNYSSLNFTFYGLEISQKTQKELYTILKECIGDELAYFLVYAKDTDGVDDQNKIVFEPSMGVCVENKNSIYDISRKITEKEDIEDNMIEFSIYLDESSIYNSFKEYDGGYKSIYDKGDMEYKINSLFPNMTDFSTTTFEDFAKEYCELGIGDYVRTNLKSVTLAKTVMDDGRSVNQFCITAQKGCSDVANMSAPELTIDYSVVKNNDEITLLDVEITGTPGPIGDTADEKTSHKKLMEINKEQMLFFFPDLDLSQIDVSSMEEQTAESTVTLMGKECKTEITTETWHNRLGNYTGEWKIEAEYAVD